MLWCSDSTDHVSRNRSIFLRSVRDMFAKLRSSILVICDMTSSRPANAAAITLSPFNKNKTTLVSQTTLRPFIAKPLLDHTWVFLQLDHTAKLPDIRYRSGFPL